MSYIMSFYFDICWSRWIRKGLSFNARTLLWRNRINRHKIFDVIFLIWHLLQTYLSSFTPSERESDFFLWSLSLPSEHESEFFLRSLLLLNVSIKLDSLWTNLNPRSLSLQYKRTHRHRIVTHLASVCVLLPVSCCVSSSFPQYPDL